MNTEIIWSSTDGVFGRGMGEWASGRGKWGGWGAPPQNATPKRHRRIDSNAWLREVGAGSGGGSPTPPAPIPFP